MDQLLARLTNLSYELFGVFVPGAIALLFLAAWWAALGPMVPEWTAGAVPTLTASTISGWIESLNSALGIGVSIPILIASYFLGHFLMWFSGPGGMVGKDSKLKRLANTITFRMQRPNESYDERLQPLLDKVLQKLSADGMPHLEWRQAYPVMKCVIAEHGGLSLVSTYQNKYTLHRSIALASVWLVWFSLCGLIAAMITRRTVALEAHGVWLIILIAIGIFLASGFSSSYRYYWILWGNVLVTESFSYLFGPKCYPKSTN